MRTVYLLAGLDWESSAARPQCLAFHQDPTSEARTKAHLSSLLENKYINYEEQEIVSFKQN